ncbi:sulfurtransferase [Candidatus Micrarchaeota archaeon]|nr:sulfurtransferase [Candidatus Micrarchaeota archaeon]
MYPFGKEDGPVKLVSTEWLESNMENVMKLDTQPNVHDYITEHLEGAVFMQEGFLRTSDKGMPAAYSPASAVQTMFRKVGLEPDVPVVIYSGKGPFRGWGDGLEQTMVAYSLARFGHNKVYVLDGGIDKWKEEGRKVTKEFPEINDSDFTVSERKNEYAISMEEVKKAKEEDGVILLDARPAKVYEGQGPWRKPGHIPGAVNLPWKSLMEEGNPKKLRDLEEVKKILLEHNVTEDKMVICSCGTGREATNEFVLLNFYLGYPRVRIYEGSFTEWTAYPENPTVTGPNPR